jgi:hypothetical protein
LKHSPIQPELFIRNDYLSMKVGARKNFNPTLDQFLDLMRARATGFHGCYAHIHDEPVTTLSGRSLAPS